MYKLSKAHNTKNILIILLVSWLDNHLIVQGAYLILKKMLLSAVLICAILYEKYLHNKLYLVFYQALVFFYVLLLLFSSSLQAVLYWGLCPPCANVGFATEAMMTYVDLPPFFFFEY